MEEDPFDVSRKVSTNIAELSKESLNYKKFDFLNVILSSSFVVFYRVIHCYKILEKLHCFNYYHNATIIYFIIIFTFLSKHFIAKGILFISQMLFCEIY